MSFKKWLTRIGNVGMTARWAARCYLALRQRYQNCTLVPDNEIYRHMIVFRFQSLPNKTEEHRLLKLCDKHTGLKDFVVMLLASEASFYDNDDATQEMFIEVICEELRKKGIPQNLIEQDRPDWLPPPIP